MYFFLNKKVKISISGNINFFFKKNSSFLLLFFGYNEFKLYFCMKKYISSFIYPIGCFGFP